jgi:hypothetical protein
MAKAKCFAAGNKLRFSELEQMLRHLLLQLLATADTLYYRISTGIQALVLAVHKLSMVT